jgi:hypothetical protein
MCIPVVLLATFNTGAKVWKDVHVRVVINQVVAQTTCLYPTHAGLSKVPALIVTI